MESQRVKLTKKNFMSFPEGAVVESNILNGGKPVYATVILPVVQRESQWKEIKAHGVDGRLCNVLRADGNNGIDQVEVNGSSILNNAKRIKLTKKLFLGLPEECFLVSSGFLESMEPAHLIKIADKDSREQQWTKIKAQKADRITFAILEDEERKNEYITQFVQMAKKAMVKK